jgi:hypothetical protein
VQHGGTSSHMPGWFRSQCFPFADQVSLKSWVDHRIGAVGPAEATGERCNTPGGRMEKF